MKIAISVNDQNIDGNVADIFARCPYFVIAEIEDNKIVKTDLLSNENIDQVSGAGISAAKLMAENNVEAVISGNVGPRALDVLKQFKIEAYTAQGLIKDAIQSFLEGKLSIIK